MTGATPPDHEAGKPARILVVDDDSVSRRLVGKALIHVGYAVEEAGNGVEAMARLEQLRPDVVLLDVVMPRMNGFETCAAIRALPYGRNLPVIMFTGLDDEHSIAEAYEAGATTFVTKPINFLNLVHRLRYIVRSKQVADRLRDREAQLQRAQRIARLGYWEWDPDLRVARLSDGTRELFGLPPEQSTLTIAQFLRRIDPRDRLATKNAISSGLSGRTNFGIEYRIALAAGGHRVIFQDSELVADDQDRTMRFVGICQDITERRIAETQIQFLASFDPMTGLPNRALFRDLLRHALADAQRHDRMVALLLLDIDQFKRINDTVGYDGGDSVLRTIAERLVPSLRGGDAVSRTAVDGSAAGAAEEAVSRLGGDEFLILLTGIRRPEDGALAAQRVAGVLNEPVVVGGQAIKVTGSIGISVYPLDSRSPDELLKSAEVAMYHAKERGRNRYQFFTSALNQRARRRVSLEGLLRRALDRNEFRLHYQPQIDLTSGGVVGAEALLRLEHPQTGPISPADFIPVAEESGLIVPIGEWVLFEAARQGRQWLSAGLPKLRIAVNLSPVQFRQPGLARRVRDILDLARFEPESMEIELTESVLLDKTSACMGALRELAELGLTIAVDDFGTGYSSLSYLRRFPVSALKIDRSFIRDVGRDPDDAAIVTAVIALAHSLRLRAVAEGVEEHHQLAFLLARGCEEAQGFMFGRPVDSESFTRWFSQGQPQMLGPLTRTA
jgi:predicted signal transduction protein with EAL and GGDEF domain/DNA-binding response OmpR family regulator